MRIKLYNFINGIRSGIPICCVLFFVKRHNDVYQETNLLRNQKSDKCGYIRCDKCFKENRKIKQKLNSRICRWILK
jgi:hypothetical protein